MYGTVYDNNNVHDATFERRPTLANAKVYTWNPKEPHFTTGTHIKQPQQQGCVTSLTLTRHTLNDQCH